MPDSGVRLSEVLLALSIATDLGLGQPAEHLLRATRIGLRIGERLGLEEPELATLYDVSLLTYVGCPIYGNEAAALFGDDIDFRAGAIEVDLAGLTALTFMLRRAGSGTSLANRARQAGRILASGGRPVVEQALPSSFDPATYRCSSALVYGNGTFSRSSTAVWSLTDLKQRTFALAPMPRGSTPTMSKRASSMDAFY